MCLGNGMSVLLRRFRLCILNFRGVILLRPAHVSCLNQFTKHKILSLPSNFRSFLSLSSLTEEKCGGNHWTLRASKKVTWESKLNTCGYDVFWGGREAAQFT